MKNPWHWIIDEATLKAQEKLVALGILRHQNGAHKAWPSLARLAAVTNLSIPSIKRAIRSLEAKNIVRVFSGKTGGRTNTYQVRQEQGLLFSKSNQIGGGGRSHRPTPLGGGRSHRPTEVRTLKPLKTDKEEEGGADDHNFRLFFSGEVLKIKCEDEARLGEWFPMLDRTLEYHNADAWCAAHACCPRSPRFFMRRWLLRAEVQGLHDEAGRRETQHGKNPFIPRERSSRE